jgi:hypothetical protein
MIEENTTSWVRAARRAALGALSILVGACSTSSSPGNAFVGSWLCADQQSPAVASDAGDNPELAQFAVTISSTASDELMAVEQVDGGTVCSLRFVSNGATASLGSGQSCLTAAGATMSYTMGTATLQESGYLVMSLAFDLPSASTSGTEAVTCQRTYSSAPVSAGGW